MLFRTPPCFTAEVVAGLEADIFLNLCPAALQSSRYIHFSKGIGLSPSCVLTKVSTQQLLSRSHISLQAKISGRHFTFLTIEGELCVNKSVDCCKLYIDRNRRHVSLDYWHWSAVDDHNRRR